MEKKFKKGDRVRFIREDCHWIEISIHNGYEGVVVGDGSGYFHNSVDVNFGGASDEISADDLELVEPYDPKTAFLSELKGLLEKYGAYLIAHKTDMPVSVYLDGAEKPCVTIGKEVNKGCGVVITSDNIMDYDKE